MQILLPWPPSNNKYYRHNRGRTHISTEGKVYRAAAAICCAYAKDAIAFGARTVSVSIIACPPDKRRRDIDNLVKAIFDSLTHAGVWNDDSQVRKLAMEWGQVKKAGEVVVDITPMPESH